MRKLIATLSVLGALAGPLAADARPIRVVATIPDLAALAQAVGGDRVQVRSLSLPTQDAHFVDARPSMALQLNRADLLIAVGRDLEVGWLPVVLTGARNPAIQPGRPGYLEAGEYAEVKGVPTGHVDRSQGDIHPTGNPHFLHDPNQGLRVARAIAERLAQIDPEHAETYRQNLETFEADAQGRIRRWERMLERHRGAKIVAYHTSWLYLLDWLGLEQLATIEPKPGIPPSPAHVARLLARMRAERPALIMQESYYPDATARLLGERADIPVLVLPGGTDFLRGETYLDHIDHVIRELAEALEGRRPAPEAHQ
jgi:zinc/manganese transport system substrate-binding protein